MIVNLLCFAWNHNF